MTSTEPVPTVIVSDARAIELEDWGPLAEATGEPMRQWGKKLWTGEGVVEAGLWECEPGPSRWLFETNESITVISGRMTVTEDGGEPREVKAGDSAVFPRGWSGTWEIHETVFKFYTAF